MTKKFEVSFSSESCLSPSFVYISESENHPGKFAVGILYPISSTGKFDSFEGIAKTFDFKQNLVSSEDEDLTWAKKWLSGKSSCIASLTEAGV